MANFTTENDVKNGSQGQMREAIQECSSVQTERTMPHEPDSASFDLPGLNWRVTCHFGQIDNAMKGGE